MRMIERWFPCSEVSDAASTGWGSGNSEASLFTWFAKRPLAQAKAAVLTSLLPWPDDPAEQRRLQDLVRRALTGYQAAEYEIRQEFARHYPGGATVLDPFSGRAMIPLEAAHLGVTAHGIDYSPVATVAGQLLADYPLRDWSGEPGLPFGEAPLTLGENRLFSDVTRTLREVGDRFAASMAEFYPMVEGKQPWGYLWAVTLPCQECGRRFPMTGSLLLRQPNPAKDDPGQSYRILIDRAAGTFSIDVHEGPPIGTPTRVLAGKSKYDAAGKVAVCPFCDHVHPKAVHTRLASQGEGRDAVLLAADLDPDVGKRYRDLTADERHVVQLAEAALATELPFANGLPAVPHEAVPPGNTWTVQATVYGVRTYGDMCNARQTLGFVRLARVIASIGAELLGAGFSVDYTRALTGYATAVLVRKLRRSTRGCTLQVNRNGVSDVFATESSLAFSYDYFEAGLGEGPGTWNSVRDGTLAALRRQVERRGGRAADIARGSAISLPFRAKTMDAVITDPPYDAMIDYSDASDLSYVWLKRAMSTSNPMLAMTSDPYGVQEKTQEIIVKKGGSSSNDPRTREHYDRLIAEAFAEAKRVVSPDGVVTIVFGHGEPEVWHRLLTAISRAGLFLTGSWPAKTEKGGKSGSANIVTTLTMSCRPVTSARPTGRANLVEAEVRREVKARVPIWEAAGLAPTDQLMASAGPAMEVVGRYDEVCDNLGNPVQPDRYLLVARRAVEEAAAIEIDHLPLETFDARTRFALSWVRLYGRAIAPKSEARWQALASDLQMDALKGVLNEAEKGVRLGFSGEYKGAIGVTSAVIDVALAMAKAWPEGLDMAGEVLASSQRDADEPYLWATMSFLSSRLPEADPDAVAWTALLRNRRGIRAATRDLVLARRQVEDDSTRPRQASLFGMSEESK